MRTALLRALFCPQGPENRSLFPPGALKPLISLRVANLSRGVRLAGSALSPRARRWWVAGVDGRRVPSFHRGRAVLSGCLGPSHGACPASSCLPVSTRPAVAVGLPLRLGVPWGHTWGTWVTAHYLAMGGGWTPAQAGQDLAILLPQPPRELGSQPSCGSL